MAFKGGIIFGRQARGCKPSRGCKYEQVGLKIFHFCSEKLQNFQRQFKKFAVFPRKYSTKIHKYAKNTQKHANTPTFVQFCTVFRKCIEICDKGKKSEQGGASPQFLCKGGLASKGGQICARGGKDPPGHSGTFGSFQTCKYHSA